MRDAEGSVRVGVATGEVERGSPAGDFEVDGVTGATYTGDGVTALLRYWLGDAYEPLLRRVREEQEEP